MVNSGSPLKSASLSALLSGLMADKSSETKALHCAKAFLDRANPIWGKTITNSKTLSFQKENLSKAHLVPDVHGMGARDAVYLMETHGIKAIIIGRGRVIQQSLAPGEKVKKGMRCELRMG